MPGTASPNRRPTIFDVFRPRSKSDAKKKEKELAKANSSDKDSGSGGSSHSGSHGGIMQSMKAAMQHTMGQKSGPNSKTRDGSAHPHAGSDAQVWEGAARSLAAMLLLIVLFIILIRFLFACFFF